MYKYVTPHLHILMFLSSLLIICFLDYVNEKLQQIFIDLTLKTEQDEYNAEGIKWENVQYFDNKPCVELIESVSSPPQFFLFINL